jgi:hypothetical protein
MGRWIVRASPNGREKHEVQDGVMRCKCRQVESYAADPNMQNKFDDVDRAVALRREAWTSKQSDCL